MNNKKVTIEQLKEGFLITDQDEERYAVTSLFSWLEKYFDILEPPEPVKPEQPKPESKKKLISGEHTNLETDTDPDTDPDRIYKPFGLSRTKVDRDQEYTKIGEI